MVSPPKDGLILRGRNFTYSEIVIIFKITQALYESGRTQISEEVCKSLDWRQPNGWLKDRACRDVLRKLNALGIIALPPPLIAPNTKAVGRNSDSKKECLLPDITFPVSDLNGKLTISVAKGNRNEKIWNSVVDKYHYLGHRITVGKTLKFLISDQRLLLAAISLSEPAWSVACRDSVLKYLGIERSHVVNNSRFLILPNVKIPNLASRILSLLTTAGIAEWRSYYNTDIECFETFVDPTLFQGTSYRAANWIPVGLTRGYKKIGASHTNHQSKKMVYLYPTNRKYRLLLKEFLLTT